MFAMNRHTPKKRLNVQICLLNWKIPDPRELHEHVWYEFSLERNYYSKCLGDLLRAGFTTYEMKVYLMELFFLNMQGATDLTWSGHDYPSLIYYIYLLLFFSTKTIGLV